MPEDGSINESNIAMMENSQSSKVLRASEERLTPVLERFSEAVWETNAQGFAVSDSLTWRDYTGQTLKEWLSHGWVHAVYADDRDLVEQTWKEALVSGRSISIECRLRYAPGGYHWTRVRAVPVPDAEGRIEKWFGMVFDMDARKRTEESLRASQEKYRTLFNSIDEGFCVTDVLFDEDHKPVDLCYVEVNAAAIRMLGDDYTGKRLRDIHPDYEQYWYQIFGKVALTGESVRLERYAAPDKKWYSFYVFKIGGPESRRIGNLFQDITERKKTDEAMIHQWRLMQRIMDELPVAVSIVQGNDLKIQYANPAFRIMAPDRELIDRTTTQAMAEGQPHIDRVLLKVLTTGETYAEVDQPYPVIRKPKGQSELAYFTSSVSRIIMPDGNWGLLILFVETTGRKSIEEELRRSKDELEVRVQERTEELSRAYEQLYNGIKAREAVEEQLRQSQKMEAIGTLAGGIAHDFNNILAGIIGFAEMVEEDLPPESKSRKHIQKVLKASERGKDLVRQILTFSRKTDLKRTPVSLKNVVRETRHLLRASIPSTIEIEIDLQAKHESVLAAPAELQQVLMNLVANAVAAMKDKGGTLRVSTRDTEIEESLATRLNIHPGSYIMLSVADTGVGIQAEFKDKIFEPFFTTKEVGQGTGLGLAVVYATLRNLGGSVTVESTEGVGSTFNIFLPVATSTQNDTALTTELPRGTERVLFVDDEETLASWGEDVLQRLGYTVTAVIDPRRALSLFSVEPFKFNIVILDQTMPKLTGFDAAKKMLEIRSDIPIILCTGHSDTISEELVKKAGIKEFLMKPVGKKRLAEAIRMALT